MRRTRPILARPALVPMVFAGLLAGAPAGAQQLLQDGEVREIKPWAGPKLLRDPVSFTIDWQGNVYVAESDRAGEAVTDTRSLTKLNGVEEDLQLRTVEDRRALINKWIAQGAFPADYFTRTEDRVRLVRDTNGDGVADASSVFAGGFNDAVDGIGAGVLWRDGRVYYTCIPNVWMLEDKDGDGVSDSRESLSYGYGVRWCFYGHDLHGLVNGPDGRIHFSMGDRGFNVTSKEGVHYYGPDRGGVFRCWPDGSGLELFHVGLRNPQELAFDEFGNLFTGDNNCDSGDAARVVYVMEGGDSGWRQNVQSLPSRGPWNREHIWELLTDPHDPSRPAWSLPPIEHLGAGPSGIAYYPGTGESHASDDTFLLVDFYGSGSTVHQFRAAPSGAGFRLTDQREYYRGTTVTDIAWGPDSRLYLSDWGEGWGPNDKGNVFTITDKTVHEDPAGAEAIEEVRSILAAGFKGRGAGELESMLGHRDQRVRLAAQYELASRGPDGAPDLQKIAHSDAAPLLQRVHAIWAIGQIARSAAGAADGLADLLSSPEVQLRIQVIRTLGDLRRGSAARFLEALKDPSLAVRAEGAIALGKLDSAEAVGPLLDALEVNDDNDVYLRSAIAYALAQIAEPDAMIAACAGRGPSARLGVVIALRRLEQIGVVGFLADPDPRVAIEAARAVYDLHLASGMPALARRIGGTVDAALRIEPFMRRAIEANVLLGDAESADRLAGLAADGTIPKEWRLLALLRLSDWDQPLKREGVWGDWVALPGRSLETARRGVLARLPAIRDSASGDNEILSLADALETKYSLQLDAGKALAQLVDPAKDGGYRLVLLEQVAQRAPETLDKACAAVLGAAPDATTPELRIRARELLVGFAPTEAVADLTAALEAPTTIERQHAVTALGAIDDDKARQAIADLASKLVTGGIPGELALETFEAAERAPAGSAARRAAETVAAREPQRPAGFQTALLLSGGEASRGRDIFEHQESAQCIRCHTISGTGGTAGPELTTVASRSPRSRLVQSVVEPNAVVAPGFGTVSAMPQMTLLLKPSQVRDVVAYLSTLADPAKGAAPDEPLAGGPGATPAHAPGAGPTAPGSVSWTVALWPVAGYVLVLAPVLGWFLLKRAGEKDL
ncbi:MAG: HEAT repeat domain-containing protein [Phycisphaerales bacterium]|nr:HEAT repeat domain-containing protein [Phycisphaerales bacterium]